jgi:HSP20 family protein
MVTRMDPWFDVLPMRDAINRLLESSFVGAPTTGASTLPFDMWEDGETIHVRIGVPGASAERTDVSVVRNLLRVKGYRSFYSGDQEKQYTWYARGLPEGEFQFALQLPTEVDGGAAQASYEDGILWIRLPKSEAVRPKRIAIGKAQAHEAIEAGA